MAGVGVNHDFDFVALLFQGLLEFPYVGDGDALIPAAENAEQHPEQPGSERLTEGVADHPLDREQGNGKVAEPRMYQLIRQPAPVADRQFEIEFLDAGVEA